MITLICSVMHLQHYIVTIKIIFLDTIYLMLIFLLRRFHYLFFSKRQSIGRQQQWYRLEEKAKFCCHSSCYFWRLQGKDHLCKASSQSGKYNFKLYTSKLCKFVLFVLFCFVFCFGCFLSFFLLSRKLVVNFWAKFCSFWKETGVALFFCWYAKNTFLFLGRMVWMEGKEGEVHLQKEVSQSFLCIFL